MLTENVGWTASGLGKSVVVTLSVLDKVLAGSLYAMAAWC